MPSLPIDFSVWHGVFWNHLVYPEHCLGETQDPGRTVAWVHVHLMGGVVPQAVVCVCLDDYDGLAPAERAAHVEEVSRLFTASLPPAQCRLLGFAHGNALYFCSTLGEAAPGARARQTFLDRLAQLRATLAASTGHSVTVGVAFLPEPSLAGWQWAAQRAIVAQRGKVQRGRRGIFTDDGSALPPPLALEAYGLFTASLHRLVIAGDLSGVGAAVAEATRLFFEGAYLPHSHLRPILQSQIILMAQAAQAAGVPPASLAEAIARDLAEVEVTYDYERLRALITHAAERFTALVHGHFHNAASRLVAAAKAHIAAHLDDPALSLGLLAAQLHVNPSYLCRRFAKAEEMGVVDYIRRARIERARCLLLDRTRTVTDVAFAVGFGSVQQFGRAFRTLTGTTPSAYRQAKSDQERSIPV